MHDQADQLRKLVRATLQAEPALAPGGPIIALSGAQPEAGVSTAACGLACELARLGKQVIFIDANLQNPAAGRLLQSRTLTRNSPLTNSPDLARSGLSATLDDVLSGKRRGTEVLLATADPHLRLLPGVPPRATPPLDRAALDRFTGELAALSRDADVILLDCGHGMNAWIDRLWQLAREILLVTPSNSQGLLDSYAAVKLAQHHRLQGKLRLLINRTIDETEAAPLAQRFAATCQKFLSLTPKPPASLPAMRATAGLSSSAKRAHAHHQGDEPTFAINDGLQRALRLLAADLTCDLRVTALRLLAPRAQRTPATHSPQTKEGLAQRR